MFLKIYFRNLYKYPFIILSLILNYLSLSVVPEPYSLQHGGVLRKSFKPFSISLFLSLSLSLI